MIQLDSIELRRLRFDLLYLYNIIFHQADVDRNDMFNFSAASTTHGHPFKLFVQRGRMDVRQ